MDKALIQSLTPRLNRLGEGSYQRTYRRRAAQKRTSVHQLLCELFDSLGVRYREDVTLTAVPGLAADFVVNGVLIFVDRVLSAGAVKKLSESGTKAVMLSRESVRSDRLDHGIRVVGIGEDPRRQTIFLDDPSFNFDYAHILPDTQKCSVMHGHTSSVLVEIVGSPVDGMVVDFGTAKEIVRQAVRSLDHKLFIRRKYVAWSKTGMVALKFKTVHGEFFIRAPKATTVLLDGEATVENLAAEVLARIAPRMPANVTAVGVYVYEGLNKGSYLLAQIHRKEGRSARKTR